MIGGYADFHLFTSDSSAVWTRGVDLLQAAFIGPKENHSIFRGYRNLGCVGPFINAHMEALP